LAVYLKPLPRPAQARTRRCALAALAALNLLGCDSFDLDRRPYTPFPVATGAGGKAGDEVPTPSPPVLPLPNVPQPALEPLIAPSRAFEWRVAERDLAAPSGMLFRLALVGGVRGGSDRDVLAWAVGTPDHPSIGELWLYPESGEPRLILSAPTFLPTGPGCSHGARLTHAGPSTVALDIEATCSGPLLPRAPERSVTLLAPLRSPPVIVGFRLAAAARDERLEMEITAADRDGDGRDDVEMGLRFGTSEAADVRARFAWLQRAAGLSRDMAEPRASFAALAELEGSRASSGTGSEDIALGAATVRRMFGSLCAESATPRIFLDDGAALDCGDLSGPFQALTSAEIAAALAHGQIVEAFAALERHGWYSSGSAASLEAFSKQQLAKLKERVVRRRVVKLVPLKAQPRAVEPGPHYGPLSFHPDGSLLVLTGDGLVRAAPDGRFEYEASDELDGWATVVASASGEQLAGIAFPCERSEVVWLRTAADGSPLEPLPTRLVAPRPGNCGSTPFLPPNVSPIGWLGAEPSAFVGASRIGAAVSNPPPGSALSPNGRYGVVATRWGLLVASEARTTLWVFDDASLPSRLSDCVVSNNAESAACLLSGRAHVILPDPKSG
jgi:hypothetical protein